MHTKGKGEAGKTKTKTKGREFGIHTTATNAKNSLFDRAERAERLVPPGAKDTIRLDVFLLVVGPLFLALVEGVLETDVGLNLTLGSLQTYETCDVERRLNVYLYDMLGETLPWRIVVR